MSSLKAQTWHLKAVHLPHIRNLGWIVATVVFCLIMGALRRGPFK